jgi:hypothetical protein
MVNHDWIFAGNQFKKTLNELLFTRRKWVENRSCCFAYFAYCVCERCLDYGRFEFTKEKNDLSFLSVWEVRDVGVLQAFVLDCRRVETIKSYAANFGSCFLGFVFARWSTSSRTSLLLTFEILDGTDKDFNTADIDDGNNADKNSVNEQEDTVEGVEHNGGNSTSKEPTRGDTICFFSWFSTLTYRPLPFWEGVCEYSPWLRLC